MKGLTIKRFFTEADATPYSLFDYEKRDSIIKNPDGSVVFEIKDVEVPKQWSQLATDILAQKYIRKAGVPQEDGTTGSEQSIKQVVNRLAGCWRHWGEKYGYFASEEDAQAFYDEIAYMLLNQMVAPNSPQWFNTGLAWAYNIRGNPQGHWFIDPESGEMKQSDDAYTRPQPHACFIQSLSDDLVNEGGIFDLALREARVFKYGSGTGSNFSNLRGRGEPLSGGGTSSGLMSFLKVFDAGAGAIKSGGTTRRAAKMVCLDMDHPEIETFIMWKYREEQKVADLVTGSQINKRILQRIADVAKEGGADWKENKELKVAIKEAKALGVSMNYIFRILQLAEQGIYDADFLGFDTHYESEAYQTVSGQNAEQLGQNSEQLPRGCRE
jgi:ribonucleoside-diphosphate reductase alpha chain